MAKSFLYFASVLDWQSSYVLNWQLSNTLDVGFCLLALADALRVAPAPHIFNSGQSSQFTSLAFKQALLATGCRISRDGWGRATDNAFIECLWRTVKWEHIYLNPADNGHHLHHQLQTYFAYYNHRRPHQILRGKRRLRSSPNPRLYKHSCIT
jgi:putative transposase